ncbi:unnamed protein product, partial [Ixodes hexagonus]
MQLVGKRYLSENIADNGGINMALQASTFITNGAADAKLPGLEKYTALQLFFLSYGNV